MDQLLQFQQYLETVAPLAKQKIIELHGDPLYAIIIQLLQALAAPFIAAIAVGIAFQQYKSARYKLRLDLFEKRFAAYRAFMKMYDDVMLRKEHDLNEDTIFDTTFYEITFLFDWDVVEFMTSTQRKLLVFKKSTLDLKRLSEAARAGILSSSDVDALEELLSSIKKQRDELAKLLKIIPAKFRPYLSLDRVL